MLSINKTYCWLFVAAMLIQIPSLSVAKFLDELLVVFLVALAVLDVLVNHRYKRYKLLWIVTGVMIFYVIYSMTCVSYNTPKAVIVDFIAQMKPFCFFCVSYAIAPKLDTKTKQILKAVCVMNAVIAVVCFVIGLSAIITVFFHPAYLGLVSILSCMVYLMCSMDENSKISKKDLIIALIILTIGLASTRSKFYGEYVLALYMLFLYKPGFMKRFSLKYSIVLVLALLLTVWVAWGKIDYYFISGGQEEQMFDEEFMESFARPMLYVGMFLLLAIHPVFGSGLASFGTYASSTEVNYSNAYAAVGLDQVWGLSEDFDSFITDSFFPVLAQFGIVGIILFFGFFVWIYKRLSLYLYSAGKMPFVIGMITIVVIMIESVASTTLLQGAGAMCMMILGYLASRFKDISKAERKVMQELPYKETKPMEYLKQ